jgi:ketosteroid isomerase-like protein
MATTATEQEVLTLEKRYWDAMQKRDIPTMESLTADPCLVVGAQGASQIRRSQFSQMMQSDDYRVRSYKFDEANASVRQLSPDVAVIAYKIHEEFERAGKPGAQDAYDSSVWIRQGGKWQCAAHTNPGDHRLALTAAAQTTRRAGNCRPSFWHPGLGVRRLLRPRSSAGRTEPRRTRR